MCRSESFATGNYRRYAEVQCPEIAGSMRVPSAADNFLPSLKSSCKTFGIYVFTKQHITLSQSKCAPPQTLYDCPYREVSSGLLVELSIH